MKKLDLHIHSTCSKHKIWGIDGLNTPQEIVEMAIKKNLDGIAITDHNSIKGSEKAIQYVKKNNIPLLIIPGSEIRTTKGDILALGINEDIQPNLTILETIDAIKDQGGLAIAAHPFKYNSKIGSILKEHSSPLPFDAIEIFNSNIRKNANNKAVQLAEMLHLPGVAGSDAHIASNIGLAKTLIEIDNLSIDSVLKAIKTGQIKLNCKYISLHNTFNLYFKKIGHLFKRIIGRGNKSCI
ncbi:MAG: CehA/McbA family metallohydrolase [Candidatus Helarchaeota archaeon]